MIKPNATLSEIITYIKTDLTDLKGNAKLAGRILLLATDPDVAINYKSLYSFLSFLETNDIKIKPSVGLTSLGYIDAKWDDSKTVTEMIFKPNGEIKRVTITNEH
jgi:hypothetical protein